MRLATVATDIAALGGVLQGDIVAWGAAAIGIALTAGAVLWVMRLVR